MARRIPWSVRLLKYVEYDMVTNKSTCLVKHCQKKIAGRRPGNIKRHFRLIHKMNIANGDDISCASTKNKPISIANVKTLKEDENELQEDSDALMDDSEDVKSLEEEDFRTLHNEFPQTPEERLYHPRPETIRIQPPFVRGFPSTQTQQPAAAIRNTAATRDDLLEMVCQQLKQNNNDEADILGKGWAFQYRDLTMDQKIFAKKAIEDIFFEAKMGTLHRNSVKINESHGCNIATQPVAIPYND